MSKARSFFRQSLITAPITDMINIESHAYPLVFEDVPSIKIRRSHPTKPMYTLNEDMRSTYTLTQEQLSKVDDPTVYALDPRVRNITYFHVSPDHKCYYTRLFITWKSLPRDGLYPFIHMPTFLGYNLYMKQQAFSYQDCRKFTLSSNFEAATWHRDKKDILDHGDECEKATVRLTSVPDLDSFSSIYVREFLISVDADRELIYSAPLKVFHAMFSKQGLNFNIFRISKYKGLSERINEDFTDVPLTGSVGIPGFNLYADKHKPLTRISSPKTYDYAPYLFMDTPIYDEYKRYSFTPISFDSNMHIGTCLPPRASSSQQYDILSK